jgi:hypothetical protein
MNGRRRLPSLMSGQSLWCRLGLAGDESVATRMCKLERQGQRAPRWAPDLGAARLVGNGRTVAMLRPDATVDWWCAPTFDDPPLCWQLLDPDGGVATFPGLALVEADSAPAGSSTRTLLRAPAGLLVEVWDALLDAGSGWLWYGCYGRTGPATAGRRVRRP